MKNFRNTYLLVALAAIAVLLASAAVAQAKTNKAAVKEGVSWMQKAGLSQFPSGFPGFKADSLSALAAARKIGVSGTQASIDRFIGSVEKDATSYAGTAGATSKLILAATAAGRNPRCFGPGSGTSGKSDLVNILNDTKVLDKNDKWTGQYGETSFDHALALLALKSAHEKIPSKAVKFASSRRGQYGWNFTLKKSAGDDVESSALMIEGLRAAGMSKNSSALKSAYKWIGFQRNGDGGYDPDTPSAETQADTTAYVVRAADALGKDNKAAKSELRKLQKRGGSFKSRPSGAGSFPSISTTNAVLALSGQHYPVVVRSKRATSCLL